MVYVVTLSVVQSGQYHVGRSVDNEMERNWNGMALRFCNGFPLRLYLSF